MTPTDRVKARRIGQRFGRLVVTDVIGLKKNGTRRWLCRCDCGNSHSAHPCNITSGDIRSCGCLLSERIREMATKHGGRYTPEYSTWINMKTRCYNRNFKQWKDWGGRGIRICIGWLDFQTFISDMGRKPTPRHTIERVNNDGNYSCGQCDECRFEGWPKNCIWETRQKQNLNKRNSTRSKQ